MLRGLKELARRGVRYDLLAETARTGNRSSRGGRGGSGPAIGRPIDIAETEDDRKPGSSTDWVAAMQAAASIPRTHTQLSGTAAEANPADWRCRGDLRP